MPSSLLTRLQPVYDETPAARTMALQHNWPNTTFGDVMAEVVSLVVHSTDGWPSRSGADSFVARYTVPTAESRGIGTQFYISSDGTVFRLIDLPRRTHHGEFINGWSCGAETGHLPRQFPSGAFAIRRWTPVSEESEDIPGAKLYVIGINGEVLVAWWTTDTYNGPGRPPFADQEMLFSEWQYRSWALLARYLAEEFGIPRNFPLLPYELRSDNVTVHEAFRRILLADERFGVILGELAAYNIDESDVETANIAAFGVDYRAAVGTPAGDKRHNRAWRLFFDAYRGFHGHGFSGAIRAGHSDHDCPGHLYDWHRFAREVWDWWWDPFDFRGTDDLSTQADVRPYRRARRETPLIEYYFGASEDQHLARASAPFHNDLPTPETFRLDPGSPVYAMANGHLVAARFSDAGGGPSLSFVLVRHEIYHQHISGNAELARGLGLPLFLADNIDYDVEPSYVYSLVMHLGSPTDIDFDQVSDGNPDWLNRVLIRLKECELGIAFHDAGETGIPDAMWNSRPPGQSGQRPTIREGWRLDLNHNLRDFVDRLRAGELGLGPPITGDYATPIKVILGDFLGTAGSLGGQGTGELHGIRIEVFSTEPISPTDFTLLDAFSAWPASEPESTKPLALRYQTEWSIFKPTVGLDINETTLINWWQDVAAHTLSDTMLPLEAHLPWDGIVWHYRLYDFMRWLNQITWRSEWLKYDITDGAGNPLEPPVAPRSRRV